MQGPPGGYAGGPPPYGYGPPWEEPQPEPDRGGRILRSTLLIAALVGVVTVIAGLLMVFGNPEEYGLADERTALELQVQPSGSPADSGTAHYFTGPPEAAAPLPDIVAAPPMMPATPKRITIKKLGVNAPITSVGLNKRGAVEVPPVSNANLVGWYRNMSTPGQAGPAVLLGHKDTRTTPAVFRRLGELRHGDVIEVERQGGTVAVFTVGGVEQADKRLFPTERVYGKYDNPQLHLVSCGGTYNHSTGHYTDNIIVYATMTSSYRR
ncbi:Sortase family protein [Sinosporangium album]|uniref:Sortase family protein n=1 Tax=Sinosporangium album TaxID=504805 RepID=A0A1G8J6B5_9ACTN|nr:class F sortase [Sinosporangium album]SDI26632.1 Sortase family protein [Sinosporangium album]